MVAAAKPIRLGELAARLGCRAVGDPDFVVCGVAALSAAGPSDLAFARSARHQSEVSASRAGALVAPDGVDVGDRPLILSQSPAVDFARAVALLVPEGRPEPGVSQAADVAADASVDARAAISAGCVIGARSRIGAGSVLHPRVTIYPDVEVGDDCVFHAGVVVREGSRIGSRVRLQPGVLIGGDGFGYIPDGAGQVHKVPQVGCVVIEDDVEVGAGTTIDRATLGETRVRRGAKLDNLVQVAHNCDIGEYAIIAAQVGLSGSTVVGAGAILMGQAGSAGHLRIGSRSFVGAKAGLHKDVPDGARVFGTPQLEDRGWHRAMAALARLPDTMRRLRRLERKLGERAPRVGAGDEESPS